MPGQGTAGVVPIWSRTVPIADDSHEATQPCALCGRSVPLTFHHLVPRKVHRRGWAKRTLSREAMQAGVYLCRMCHSGVHRLHDETKLARELNTLEALRADAVVAKHVAWVRKQKRAF